MKKLLFIAAAAAFVITSCNTPTNTNENPSGTDSSMMEPMPQTDSLDSMPVDQVPPPMDTSGMQ